MPLTQTWSCSHWSIGVQAMSPWLFLPATDGMVFQPASLSEHEFLSPQHLHTLLHSQLSSALWERALNHFSGEKGAIHISNAILKTQVGSCYAYCSIVCFVHLKICLCDCFPCQYILFDSCILFYSKGVTRPIEPLLKEIYLVILYFMLIPIIL